MSTSFDSSEGKRPQEKKSTGENGEKRNRFELPFPLNFLYVTFSMPRDPRDSFSLSFFRESANVD